MDTGVGNKAIHLASYRADSSEQLTLAIWLVIFGLPAGGRLAWGIGCGGESGGSPSWRLRQQQETPSQTDELASPRIGGEQKVSRACAFVRPLYSRTHDC